MSEVYIYIVSNSIDSFFNGHFGRLEESSWIQPEWPFKLLEQNRTLKIFAHFLFPLSADFEPTFCEAKGRAILIMRRLGGVSRRHRIVFEIVSNFLVEREGWHRLGRKTGRAPIRGQQIVWKIQAEFGLLKRKKEMCKNFSGLWPVTT